MILPGIPRPSFPHGQRFPQAFNGKQAIVGWEPDTFGHTWQFPDPAARRLQSAAVATACPSSGGNRGRIKVSAPENPPPAAVQRRHHHQPLHDRLFNWEDKTGVEMLWGLRRRQPTAAAPAISTRRTQFQEINYLPKVQFSTATEFFLKPRQAPPTATT